MTSNLIAKIEAKLNRIEREIKAERKQYSKNKNLSSKFHTAWLCALEKERDAMLKLYCDIREAQN